MSLPAHLGANLWPPVVIWCRILKLWQMHFERFGKFWKRFLIKVNDYAGLANMLLFLDDWLLHFSSYNYTGRLPYAVFFWYYGMYRYFSVYVRSHIKRFKESALAFTWPKHIHPILCSSYYWIIYHEHRGICRKSCAGWCHSSVGGAFKRPIGWNKEWQCEHGEVLELSMQLALSSLKFPWDCMHTFLPICR